MWGGVGAGSHAVTSESLPLRSAPLVRALHRLHIAFRLIGSSVPRGNCLLRARSCCGALFFSSRAISSGWVWVAQSDLARAAAASCRGAFARSSRPAHPSCRTSSPCALGLLCPAPFQLLNLVRFHSNVQLRDASGWVQGGDIAARSGRCGFVPWRSRALLATSPSLLPPQHSFRSGIAPPGAFSALAAGPPTRRFNSVHGLGARE